MEDNADNRQDRNNKFVFFWLVLALIFDGLTFLIVNVSNKQARIGKSKEFAHFIIQRSHVAVLYMNICIFKENTFGQWNISDNCYNWLSDTTLQDNVKCSHIQHVVPTQYPHLQPITSASLYYFKDREAVTWCSGLCSSTHLLCTQCCSSSRLGRSQPCRQSPAPAPVRQTQTPVSHPLPNKGKHMFLCWTFFQWTTTQTS